MTTEHTHTPGYTFVCTTHTHTHALKQTHSHTRIHSKLEVLKVENVINMKTKHVALDLKGINNEWCSTLFEEGTLSLEYYFKSSRTTCEYEIIIGWILVDNWY